MSLRAVFAVTTDDKTQQLKQSGLNKGGGNYKFYSQTDLEVVTRMVHQHQCMNLFGSNIHSITSGYNRVKGKNNSEYDRLTTHTACSATYRVQSVANANDWVEVEMYGFKVDMSSDKALGAATIAKRYAIMAMFDIATIEGDPDGSDDIRIQDRQDLLGPKQLTNNLVGGTQFKLKKLV